MKALRWVSHKSLFEEDFFCVIDKLLDINEFEGNFYCQVEQLIQLSEIPQACVVYPNLYFYSDSILKHLVIQTGMHSKLLTIVVCFNKCFINSVRKSELEPCPCIGHFYPSHLRSFIALLSISPSDVDDVRTHINRMSDTLVNVQTKERDWHSELHWMVLKFGWWTNVAVDIIITMGEIDCFHGAAVLLGIYLDYRDWIEIAKVKQLVSFVLLCVNCQDNYQDFAGCLSLDKTELLFVQQLMFLVLSSHHFWTQTNGKGDKICHLIDMLKKLFDGDGTSLLAMTLDVARCHLTRCPSGLHESGTCIQHQASCRSLVRFVKMLQKCIVDELHRNQAESKLKTETAMASLLADISKFVERMSISTGSVL
ncbi:uncharacterized protein LOC134185826 [Corticium candelabrum]|uniref:uncharacterized protein LOC134185826 n=1 Tax=Corticium candelabrum TaxID=121492 RepID=UPI002E25E652|nr:uncharacterized protein LOC134185826 [Corticium candelabrum]